MFLIISSWPGILQVERDLFLGDMPDWRKKSDIKTWKNTRGTASHIRVESSIHHCACWTKAKFLDHDSPMSYKYISESTSWLSTSLQPWGMPIAPSNTLTSEWGWSVGTWVAILSSSQSLNRCLNMVWIDLKSIGKRIFVGSLTNNLARR